MKMHGLDHLYEMLVQTYALAYPEKLDEEFAFRDGRRERLFGIIEGVQDAITLAVYGAITQEYRAMAYEQICDDVAHYRVLNKVAEDKAPLTDHEVKMFDKFLKAFGYRRNEDVEVNV